MIEWWGPIVWEYYGGTEGNGLTMCNASEWLAHKGTVGRAVVGTLRICDEDGNELPPGEAGTVYFADGRPFEYHNDPEEDRRIAQRQGLDDAGRRRLRRRRRLPVPHRPQGLHDHLGRREHLPAGGREPADHPSQGHGLRGVRRAQRRLRRGGEGRRPAARHGRRRRRRWPRSCWPSAASTCSAIKCPRCIDFEAELPRHPTGKLYKRLLRDRYWKGRESKIV